VENFGLAAYVALVIFLILAVVTNYRNVNPADNPIIHRYGANSVCIFIDEPPFMYTAAALYVPVALLFGMFALLKFARLYLEYHVGQVRLRTLRLFGATAVVECICPCIFTQSFGTQPRQSEIGHALPYVIFMVGLLVQGVSTVAYYFRDAHPKTPRWLFVYMVAYLVLFGINAACFFLVVVNAFGRVGGLAWDVKSSFGDYFASFVFKFLFATSVALPMGLFFVVEPYVADVRITLTRDLTDMVSPTNAVKQHDNDEGGP